MRKLISYEMQEMFVGSEGAFEPSKNTGQYVSRLDFIQNYGFNFSVNRQPLKQIGSSLYPFAGWFCRLVCLRHDGVRLLPSWARAHAREL